jgi:hypothetical protein
METFIIRHIRVGIPDLVLTLVFAVTLDGLRDALDPRLRGIL